MESPVFICGCYRSGTTLLGSIIGGNQNYFVTPESQFKQNVIKGETDYSNLSRLHSWGISRDAFSKLNSRENLLYQILEYYKSKNGIDSNKGWVDHTPDNIQIT